MLKPLWAEQDPDNWWHAGQAAIGGVLHQAGAEGKDIAGVGLTGQMHGLVLLNAQNKVIRPALIWCDQRSQKQVDFINSKLGADFVLKATANPVLTGFTLPKLLWVRDNEPGKFEAVRKILLPKDYLRFKLTGEFASDVSDASGTSLFDVVNRKWSSAMMAGLGLDNAILPRVYESSEVTGQLSAEAAAATGLRVGIPVVAGAGDQAASAIGNGIVKPGTMSCTIGTSGVVFAYLQEPAYDPQGRVHTSTVTVAVLPEAEEVDVTINPSDLRIDVYRSSGAGGQHVNTTDSAVRVTHIPTGVVVACQEERSQHKNKAKAMKLLQSRLLAAQMEKSEAEMRKQRKEQVGTGERAEKVRTYNFPQNRVTDHQVDVTLKKLDMVMEGNMDEIIDALMDKEREDRKKNPALISQR